MRAPRVPRSAGHVDAQACLGGMPQEGDGRPNLVIGDGRDEEWDGCQPRPPGHLPGFPLVSTSAIAEERAYRI